MIPSPQRDWLYWMLAVLFAFVSGYAHVRINDSGLAVVFVTAFTMFLAYKRPRRIWRWIMVMALSLPMAVVVAQVTQTRPPLGMVAGSFAGSAFAIVAGIGGQLLRRAVDVLFPQKNEKSTESISKNY
ncbi:MAG TPA: hypothetical protein VFP40_09930 [Terriglobales bacterium]|nr:hypothetical protein [Terriglobales bacterium]